MLSFTFGGKEIISPLPPQLPTQLIQSLQQTPGFNEAAFIKAHEKSQPVTSIRFNADKLARSGYPLPAERVPWCPYGYYLAERPSFTFDPLFHGGLYYVQDASSMFLWHVLQQTTGAATTGKKVLDLCAAPGGKSTLLASYFSDGLLVSNEVIKSRASILSENITKWGSGNVVVTNNDPAHFQRLEHFFDVVVIDAPCSGSGLFRKDNAAIAEWSSEAVHLCSLRQRRIVADAYSCLAQNGCLIYATCSYSEAEDEEILDWMMETFQLFTVQIEQKKEWNIVESRSRQNKAYGYRFYPNEVKGEGFFIAAFVKREVQIFHPTFGASLPLLSKREAAVWQPWLTAGNTFFLLKQKDTVMALGPLLAANLSLLQKALYIKQAGILLGVQKGNDVIPHHALALSEMINPIIKTLPFTAEQAIQYLQKKEIDIDLSLCGKGWHLATFCGIGLGWLKVLPNRINNYYPTEWRILKN